MKSRLTDVILAQYKRPLSYLCLLALAGALPSFAATVTVNNTNDSGAGSLRDAIAQSASAPVGQSTLINFQTGLSGTILLESALSICNGQNLTIQGPGATKIVVNGQNNVGVFYVCQGVTATISGLTIENGAGSGYGGGIENIGGAVTVSNSTFSGNSAVNYGGAIYNDFYSSGVVAVTNSTFSGNSAGYGGAIFNLNNVTVSNSTFSGNSAVYYGGALYNDGSNMAVINSTFSGNSSPYGGAIANGGPLDVTNSTFFNNSATQSGGGGGIEDIGSAALTLKSNILASNPGGNCNEGGSVSQGYNVSDDDTCAFSGTGDLNNTPAGLDPHGLANNGGPTQTIALAPGSRAIDAIPVAACTDTNGQKVTTDQRGIIRPQGKGCDSGAYELVQAVAFRSFYPSLAIDSGRHPGFVLTSTFTLGSGTSGLNPATEAMTLTIANYTLTLPAGSFHQLWNASNAPYAYDGRINGANLVLGLIPLGNNTFAFDAAGAPVTFTGVMNPVMLTLSFGNDTGSTPVHAAITNF